MKCCFYNFTWSKCYCLSSDYIFLSCVKDGCFFSLDLLNNYKLCGTYKINKTFFLLVSTTFDITHDHMRKQFKNGSVLTTILSKLNGEIIIDKA